jgi:hypothetical protein
MVREVKRGKNIQFIVNGIINLQQTNTKTTISCTYKVMILVIKSCIVQTTYIVRRRSWSRLNWENAMLFNDRYSLPLLPHLPPSSSLSLHLLSSPSSPTRYAPGLEHPQMISPENIRSGNLLLNRHPIHLIPSLLIVAITIIVPMRV